MKIFVSTPRPGTAVTFLAKPGLYASHNRGKLDAFCRLARFFPSLSGNILNGIFFAPFVKIFLSKTSTHSIGNRKSPPIVSPFSLLSCALVFGRYPRDVLSRRNPGGALIGSCNVFDASAISFVKYPAIAASDLTASMVHTLPKPTSARRSSNSLFQGRSSG